MLRYVPSLEARSNSRPRFVGGLAVPRALILLSFAASSVAFGADWRQFRGPSGLGLSAEKGLPTSWSDTENVVWKTPLVGAGASSPIVVGDRIFVTAYTGYGVEEPGKGNLDELRLHVLCIDAADGKIRWKRELEPRQPESERVRDHGYAAPTPVSDGKHVWVFFGRTGVFKFDLDGKTIWHVEVGDETHGWGCGTSPVLVGDVVVVNASVESGSLVALDQKSGKEVWRARGMKESWNTPLVVELSNGKKELVVSVQGLVLAFDPATGKELWRCKGIEDYVCPSIIAEAGIVYVVGGRQSRAIAIRAGGTGDVSDTNIVWEAKAGANVSSPVIRDGYLYGVSDRTTVAYCIRLSDGEVVFSERVRGQPYASAVGADGKIYVVLRQGGTLVLAAEPTFKILATNRFEDRSFFNASPAIANGRIYLRSDRFLYAIGKK
jgi:outer membrane protein assembly factor BamB